MLSVGILSVAILSVVILSVGILSVGIPSVCFIVILSVVAPIPSSNVLKTFLFTFLSLNVQS